jgi:hypothetical protein
MFTLIIFAFGYFLGGLTALAILGMARAAQRGDIGASAPPRVPPDEAVAAWHHKQ